MRNIADTINRLNSQRRLAEPTWTKANTRLCILPDFGSNPGDLLAWTYIPKRFQPGSPLVVVLHGCTQTAADYSDGSGWSELADKFGFALLFPEQQRKNNPNLCFNWFATEDTARGQGEVHSIRQMIEVLKRQAFHRPGRDLCDWLISRRCDGRGHACHLSRDVQRRRNHCRFALRQRVKHP